jgi:hypothetical protein
MDYYCICRLLNGIINYFEINMYISRKIRRKRAFKKFAFIFYLFLKLEWELLDFKLAFCLWNLCVCYVLEL